MFLRQFALFFPREFVDFSFRSFEDHYLLPRRRKECYLFPKGSEDFFMAKDPVVEKKNLHQNQVFDVKKRGKWKRNKWEKESED